MTVGRRTIWESNGYVLVSVSYFLGPLHQGLQLENHVVVPSSFLSSPGPWCTSY